jgi:hypothetical protein
MRLHSFPSKIDDAIKPARVVASEKMTGAAALSLAFRTRRPSWTHAASASLFLGLLVAPSTLSARADTESKPERDEFVEPITLEETMPNDPGELTLRLTSDYRRGGGSGATGLLPNGQVFYGVLDRVGVSVSIPLAYARPDASSHYGLGDLSAGLKVLVLRPDPQIPALVAGVEAAFPTGNSRLGLGDGAYELIPNIALLRDFGALCVQGGIGWQQPVGIGRNGAWTYGWAISVPLVRNKLHGLTEIQGDWSGAGRTALAPGLKYNFTDRITLGMAVPIGLNHRTEHWGLVTQFQVSL